MAQTREIIKQNTWRHLKKKYPALVPADPKEKLAIEETRKVHCRIPLCIGYKEDIQPAKLDAIISDILKKGFDFTLYLAPRDEEALSKWKEQHAELLNYLEQNDLLDKLELETDLRKTKTWLVASESYEAYRTDPVRAEMVADKLKVDVDRFKRRHKGSSPQPKNRDSEKRGQGEDQVEDQSKYEEKTDQEIAAHTIDCVKDCISWMSPKSEAPGEISVLVYPNGLTQVMYNAIQNANNLGYREDSLIYAPVEFTEELVNESTPPIFGDNKLISELVLVLGSQGIDPAWSGQFIYSVADSATKAKLAVHSTPEQQFSTSYLLSKFARENANGKDVKVVTVPISPSAKLIAVGTRAPGQSEIVKLGEPQPSEQAKIARLESSQRGLTLFALPSSSGSHASPRPEDKSAQPEEKASPGFVQKRK